MRFARGLFLTGLLAWALKPELSRYGTERALRFGSTLVQLVLTPTAQVPDRAAALSRIAEIAASASTGLPSDPRPWLLAGNAHLLAGDSRRAIEDLRQALAAGERGDTDLLLARAYAAAGQNDEATAAGLRAGWVSPGLLSTLPPDIAGPLSGEVARLEEELKAGRLTAPPELP